MATQSLKHRLKDDPTNTTKSSAAASTGTAAAKNQKARKIVVAKRGLRSLAVAVAIPVGLAALSACLSGTATTAIYHDKAGGRPFWHPPVWAFHLMSLSTASLMGLSAWLVWADGGFHRQPTPLPMFLAQLLLGLAWGPLVFRLGATRVGLVVCMVLFAVLFACSQSFQRVNPIAGDLLKPYLAWVSFLALFTYKLV